METLTKKTKYRWENRLSYNDRSNIVGYYLEGYGLDRIGKTFGVTASTIEYHLKAADVFVPFRRPTLFKVIPAAQNRPCQTVVHTLVARPVDTDTHYFDEFGERYNRPKSYQQIMRQQMSIQARKPKVKKVVIEDNHHFLIRVNMNTGTVIQRGSDGHYEITTQKPDSFVVSTSLYSI